FQYVLNQSTADYFMWAADDDEWDPRFIETCVEHMLTHDVGTVMPGFMRHNRALGVKGPAQLPKMTGQNRHGDVMAFYQTTPHSMFYGLHRKSTIEWFGAASSDLADDEYFLVRQMLEHGILTLPETVLYVAGIEDAKYQVKLPKEADDRYFFQGRRLLHFARLFLESSHLTDLQKLELMQKVVMTKISFILNFESEMRDPAQFALARMLYVFLAQLDVKHLPIYINLMAQTNQALKAQAEQHSMAEAA
ncbi:MAG: glycosyltransferase, partial [Rubrivivax sp.]|nr:glycosyltransferase [Rubrivivax sp.]